MVEQVATSARQQTLGLTSRPEEVAFSRRLLPAHHAVQGSGALCLQCQPGRHCSLSCNMIVPLLSTRAGGAGLVLDPDSTEPDPCRPCLGPSFTAVVGLTTFATRTALRALRLGPQERLQTKCLKVSSADDTDIKNNTHRLTPSAG